MASAFQVTTNKSVKSVEAEPSLPSQASIHIDAASASRTFVPKSPAPGGSSSTGGRCTTLDNPASNSHNTSMVPGNRFRSVRYARREFPDPLSQMGDASNLGHAEMQDSQYRRRPTNMYKENEFNTHYQAESRINQLEIEAQRMVQELQEKDRNIEDLRQRKTQIAIELNRIRVQSQRFPAVFDSEIISKVMMMRYKIRDFVIHYFEDDEEIDSKLISCELIERQLQMDSRTFAAFMSSPLERPLLVRLFLWAVLRAEIFGRFCWAGKDASKAMCDLMRMLKSPEAEKGSRDLEAKRKFQRWRAGTAVFLADARSADQVGEYGKCGQTTIDYIYDALYQYSRSRSGSMKDEVASIIEEALNLDKLLSMHPAEIQWMRVGILPFDKGCMELTIEARYAGGSQHRVLVLAPGMIKRGRCTGEEYDLETMLLKMEVVGL